MLSDRLAQLLRDARRVGMVGHVEVNDPSSVVFDHEPDRCSHAVTAGCPNRASSSRSAKTGSPMVPEKYAQQEVSDPRVPPV